MFSGVKNTVTRLLMVMKLKRFVLANGDFLEEELYGCAIYTFTK